MTKKHNKELNHINLQQEDYIAVLCYSINASTELVFSNLSEKYKKKIILLEYKNINIFNLSKYENFVDTLINANMVIFARVINKNLIKLSSLLTELGINYYYYSDDNFFELNLIELNSENIRFVNNAEGCLLTSENLIQEFKSKNLNENFIKVGPVASPEMISNKRAFCEKFKNLNHLNFLYASNHRADGLADFLPIIANLKTEYKITFYIFRKNEQKKEIKTFCKMLKKMGVNVEFLSEIQTYEIFIEKIKHLNIHFILHPQSKTSKMFLPNHKYKTLNFLLNSYLSPSIILLPDMEPYSILKKEKMLKNLIYSEPAQTKNVIYDCLNNEEYLYKIFDNLESYVNTNFDYKKNEAIFEQLLKKHPIKTSISATDSEQDLYQRFSEAIPIQNSLGNYVRTIIMMTLLYLSPRKKRSVKVDFKYLKIISLNTFKYKLNKIRNNLRALFKQKD